MSEIETLREALRVQWEYNHFEHCAYDWPHPKDTHCMWPLPVLLGGDPTEYRPYAE